MANVIEGEGIPVLEQVVASVPVEEGKEKPLTGPIMYAPMVPQDSEFEKTFKKYEAKYGGLSRQERIEKLEGLMQDVKEFSGPTTEVQRISFGYLTTIYAMELYYSEGSVVIPNLDFLSDFSDKPYLLAGAAGFKVVEAQIEGPRAFYGMQYCEFDLVTLTQGKFGLNAVGCFVEEMVSEAQGAFSSSEKCSVGKLSGNYTDFGHRSEDLTVQEMTGSGNQVGVGARRMKIGVANGDYFELLKSSRDCHIKDLTTKARNVGEDTRSLHVEKVNCEGSLFGTSSSDLRVDEVVKLGSEAASSSTNAKFGKVHQVTHLFGYKSAGMRVDLIEESGGAVGRESSDFYVKKVVATKDKFGVESGGLRADLVESAGREFGRNSNDLKIGELVEVDGIHLSPTGEHTENRGFLEGTSNVYILKLHPKPYSDPKVRQNKILLYADGTLSTNLNIQRYSAKMKEVFDVDVFAEVSELL